jgi:ribosomal protein S12 methylthiotransferase accessory factor YcaO
MPDFYADPVAARLAALKWGDGWMHQLRDEHGRWTSGGMAPGERAHEAEVGATGETIHRAVSEAATRRGRALLSPEPDRLADRHDSLAEFARAYPAITTRMRLTGEPGQTASRAVLGAPKNVYLHVAS